jgi:hypothetical protein
MAKSTILEELPKHTRKAVGFYWQTRTQQVEKQRQAGPSDQGLRFATRASALRKRVSPVAERLPDGSHAASAHGMRGPLLSRVASRRLTHPASRLVQMFSFTGDTVLDPFCGTATTMVAALKHGRNSVGVELDTAYCKLAASRLMNENTSLFGQQRLEIELKPHAAVVAAPVLNESGPEYLTAKKGQRPSAIARSMKGKYEKLKN